MCLRGRLRGRFGEAGGGGEGGGFKRDGIGGVAGRGKGRGWGVQVLLLFGLYIIERASDKGLSFFFVSLWEWQMAIYQLRY